MGRKPRRVIGWRSFVVCALLGAFLAALSVPVSAIAHRRWGANITNIQPVIDVYVEHEDHVVFTSWTLDLGHAFWFSVYDERPPGTTAQDSRLYAGEPQSPTDPRPPFARGGFVGRERTVGVFQNGFPFLAAQGRVMTTRGPTTWASGSASEEWILRRTVRGTDTAIPYRPMWIGLLANVLVYSLLLLCPLIAWRLWRRSRRVKEGHCEHCGYDLVGLEGPCPECGASKA